MYLEDFCDTKESLVIIGRNGFGFFFPPNGSKAHLSEYQWGSYLAGLLDYKVEVPTKMGSMNRNDSSSTRLPTESKRIDKVSERFNKEEINKESTPFYENKYFIYGTIFVASCLTYYYFGDEIKVFAFKALVFKDLNPINLEFNLFILNNEGRYEVDW